MEIKCKFNLQQNVVERSNWKSRKVWVITEDNPDYPQTIEMEVSQDKIDLFSGLKQGQPITAFINLRGREWTNPQGEVKVFNTLSCWKVEADKPKATKPGNIEENFKEDLVKELENENDDLPF